MNTASLPAYGADPAGLICGHVMQPNVRSHALESADAARWLDARALADDGAFDPGEDAFLWSHFNLSHTGALPWLKRHAGLGASFFDMLTDALRSTRIERVVFRKQRRG